MKSYEISSLVYALLAFAVNVCLIGIMFVWQNNILAIIYAVISACILFAIESGIDRGHPQWKGFAWSTPWFAVGMILMADIGYLIISELYYGVVYTYHVPMAIIFFLILLSAIRKVKTAKKYHLDKFANVDEMMRYSKRNRQKLSGSQEKKPSSSPKSHQKPSNPQKSVKKPSNTQKNVKKSSNPKKKK